MTSNYVPGGLRGSWFYRAQGDDFPPVVDGGILFIFDGTAGADLGVSGSLVEVRLGQASTDTWEVWPGGVAGAGLRTIPANDVDVTVDAFHGTTIVLYSALSAPRTVTLPPASGPTQIVIAIDVNGQVSSDNSVTLVPADGDSLAKSGVLNEPQAFIEVTNDGAALWAALDSTQQMSYALDQIAAILGQPTGASIVRKFPFAFDTPGILIGAPLYTPTLGDEIIDAYITLEEVWDGVTPTADIGAFTSSHQGWFSIYWAPIDLTGAPGDNGVHSPVGGQVTLAQLGTLLAVVNTMTTQSGTPPLALVKADLTTLAQAPRTAPGTVVNDDPICVCVSQDGTNTGDDPGSTQGAGTLYIITSTPVAA